MLALLAGPNSWHALFLGGHIFLWGDLIYRPLFCEGTKKEYTEVCPKGNTLVRCNKMEVCDGTT